MQEVCIDQHTSLSTILNNHDFKLELGMKGEFFTILQRIEYNLLLTAKQVLNIEDAMYLTGLSRSHLYKLTCSRKIPYYKPEGKQIYFDRTELEAWLKRNRVNTVDEVEQEATNYLVTGQMKKGGRS